MPHLLAILRRTRLRLVLIEENQEPVASFIECVAREWGVGIMSLRCGACPEVLVPASPAETGVPSVYRWWVAELAYERYLYESAQPDRGREPDGRVHGSKRQGADGSVIAAKEGHTADPLYDTPQALDGPAFG